MGTETGLLDISDTTSGAAEAKRKCPKRLGCFGYSADFLKRKTVRSDNDSIRKL